MAKRPIRSNPLVAQQMEEVVATGVSTYLHEFTKEIFIDYRSPESQDIIAAGIIKALKQYERMTDQPLVSTVLFNLLDMSKEPVQ